MVIIIGNKNAIFNHYNVASYLMCQDNSFEYITGHVICLML